MLLLLSLLLVLTALLQRLLMGGVGNVDRADGVVDCVDEVAGGIDML